MPGEAIWLPAESIYLEKAETPPVRPFRPWNQGDIFEAPVVVLGKPPKELDPDSPPDPKAWAKSKTDLVILLGHPCSIRGGATPAIFQNVAHVRPAKDRERERFAELKAEEHPWEAYYQLFPLPELRDGQLWVADFNIIGTVHSRTWTPVAGSVACRSRVGRFRSDMPGTLSGCDQSLKRELPTLRGPGTS